MLVFAWALLDLSPVVLLEMYAAFPGEPLGYLFVVACPAAKLDSVPGPAASLHRVA